MFNKIYIFLFQNILHPFFFRKKSKYFKCGQGFDPPPPFADQSATNRWIVYTSIMDIKITDDPGRGG